MSKPQVIDIPTHQDDRGIVYCAMDNLPGREIKRTYVVENHSRGLVRAWHGHNKGHTYMHVLSGAVKIAAMKIEDHGKIISAVLTDRKPQLFYIPPGYYNGAMSLTDGTKILVYSTLTFEEVKLDDERASWTINKDLWGVAHR